MQHQLEGLAPIAAARIGLFYRQLRAMQHTLSKNRFRVVLDWPEEANAHLSQILWVGDFPCCAHIDVRPRVVGVVGRAELGIGAHIRWLSRIGSNFAVARRSWRMRATLTYSLFCARVYSLGRILPQAMSC